MNHLLAVSFAFLLISCPPGGGPSDDDSSPADWSASLEELCPVNCDTIESCYGFSGGETHESCTAQCIEWRTEDLDRMGDTCDALLIELLDCQYNLECADYINYSENGQVEGDPCWSEFNAFHFTNDCMGGAN